MQPHEDGHYEWTASRDLYRDLGALWTVLRLFACVAAAVWVLLVIFSIGGQGLAGAVASIGWMPLYITLGMLAVIVAVYFLYASAQGGRYTVRFVMDERGVRSTQQGPLARDRRTGKPVPRSSMFTGFASVTRAVVDRRRHIIRLRATISNNQVFTAPGDFAFVEDYILTRCPKAEVIRRE